jgi:LPS-assembly protein
MRFLLLCFFSLISLASHAQSVADGVLINAQDMDRDMEKQIVHLKGNVQVVFQGQHLSCDRAEIDLKRQSLRAEGHVILDNARVHVEGDRVVFNYKQNTGFIYNGFVQSGQVIFEGDLVEKVGEQRYIASNADFTACDTCPAGWSFGGRVIDAELGGYAHIKRPVFKIAGWPILILPSLIVPLKSSRQSGFLVPTQGYSGKGGFAIGESYFWAINRSQDLTLTAKHYAQRGYKADAEYRYMLSPDSYGTLRSIWIPDREFHSEPEVGLNHVLDRWLVDYTHHYEMPDNYVHRADIHATSDLRYARDFPEELKGWGDPALENRTSITKSTDNTYASAEVDYYDNMLKGYPLAPNDDAVHRLPEIKYALKEHQLFENGPYVNFNLDYTNFARASSNYDDMTVRNDPFTGKPAHVAGTDANHTGLGPHGEIYHDGVFNPGTDVVRTGQRLDMQPTLSYPFQIFKKFDILPYITYRETQYRFYVADPSEEFAPTAARRYVEEDLRVKTEFSHVFGSKGDAQGTRWKHAIEPEVGYSYIPWMRRPNHPFFGDFNHVQFSRQFDPISDSDLSDPNTGLQFDYEDRTINKRVVDFVLSNRITRKTWLNGEPSYQSVGLFRIWQAYDYASRPYPWSSLNSLLDVRFQNFETNSTIEYNGYAKILNTNSRLKVMPSPNDYVQVSYVKYRDFNSSYQLVDGETRNIGVGGGYINGFLEFGGEIDFALTTSKLQQWQYELRLHPPGHCWLLRFDHMQIQNGDRQFHFSVNFDFGGAKPQSAVASNAAPPTTTTTQ